MTSSPLTTYSPTLLNSEKENSTFKLAKLIILGGIPTILCLELSILSQFINVFFIGSLNDPILLGAFGVATVWLNGVGYSVFISLDTGFLTLAAQAFGKKDFQLVGLYFQRGCLINFALFLLSFLFLVFSRPFLRVMGINEEVVDLVMEYIIYSIPSVFFFAYYDLAKSFLQIQNVFYPQMILQMCSSVCHIVLAYYLVGVLGWKLKGAALARSCVDLLNLLFICIYIHFKNPHPNTLFCLKKEAFKGWGNYITVAVAVAMSYYLETICYEFLTILAGNLDNSDYLAAHVALANISTIFFFIAAGLSIGMQNFVGSALGEGKAEKGRKLAKIGTIINTCLAFFFFFMIMIFQKYLIYIFTNEDTVISVLEDLIKIYLFFILFDFTQVLLAGIMKAIGFEQRALKVYLVIYYLIGLPLSFIIAFPVGLGVQGIWIGWTISVFLTAITFGVIVLRTDWEVQGCHIRERLLKEQETMKEGEEIEVVQKMLVNGV